MCAKTNPSPLPRPLQFLSNSNETAAVREELDRWQQQYVDVEELYQQLQAERAHTARLRAEKDQLNTELQVRVRPGSGQGCVELMVETRNPKFAMTINLVIECQPELPIYSSYWSLTW